MRRSNGVVHLLTLTSLAICSSDLQPTYHTEHRLVASCGPSQVLVVQAAVAVYLSTSRRQAETRIGGDGDS